MAKALELRPDLRVTYKDVVEFFKADGCPAENEKIKSIVIVIRMRVDTGEGFPKETDGRPGYKEYELAVELESAAPAGRAENDT